MISVVSGLLTSKFEEEKINALFTDLSKYTQRKNGIKKNTHPSKKVNFRIWMRKIISFVVNFRTQVTCHI